MVKTVATEGTGVPELAAAVDAYRAHIEGAGLREQKRIERWQDRLLDLIRERALERVLKASVGKDKLAACARQVARGERDPYGVVEELLKAAGVNG